MNKLPSLVKQRTFQILTSKEGKSSQEKRSQNFFFLNLTQFYLLSSLDKFMNVSWWKEHTSYFTKCYYYSFGQDEGKIVEQLSKNGEI